jgi:hypothetical protein
MESNMAVQVRELIDYWAGVAGRPLSSFEQMKVARPFRYNVADKKLYRVLKPVVLGSIYGYVELDLNFNRQGQTKYDFDLLVHNQGSDFHSDKFLSDLPVAERQCIEGLHSYKVAQWILYGDLWSQIDHNRLHYLSGRTTGIRRIRLAEVVQPGEVAEQLMN